jgi:hypothetical protein
MICQRLAADRRFPNLPVSMYTIIIRLVSYLNQRRFSMTPKPLHGLLAVLMLLPATASLAAPGAEDGTSLAAPPATPPDPQFRNEAQGLQAPKVTGPDSERNSYHFFGSLKVRLEQTGYFGSSKADPNYTFAGSILRFGVRRETHTDDFMLELAAPGLFGLPQHASAPSPQGALGQGATYFASNGKRAASLFPRQLYERFKSVGGSSKKQTD